MGRGNSNLMEVSQPSSCAHSRSENRLGAPCAIGAVSLREGKELIQYREKMLLGEGSNDEPVVMSSHLVRNENQDLKAIF